MTWKELGEGSLFSQVDIVEHIISVWATPLDVEDPLITFPPLGGVCVSARTKTGYEFG